MEIEMSDGRITLQDGKVTFSREETELAFGNSDELHLALTHLLKLMAVDSCVHGMVCSGCQEVVC